MANEHMRIHEVRHGRDDEKSDNRDTRDCRLAGGIVLGSLGITHAAKQATWGITMRKLLRLSIFLGFWSASHPALAQQLSPDDGLRRVTTKDLTDAFVALVNTNVWSGLGGFTFNVDESGPQSELKYQKADLFLPIDWGKGDPEFDLYTEIALGALKVTDDFFVENNLGQRILIDADRDIFSARGGVGFNYRPTTEWRLTPIVGMAWSHFDNKVRASGGSLDLGTLTPAQRAVISDFDAQTYGVSVALEGNYDRWFGERDYHFEASGRYSHIFTETFNESTPIVKASGHADILALETRWTVFTDRTLFGEPLAWNLTASHTSFIGQDRDILGFNNFFRVGAGIDLFIQRRIFGQSLDFVGLAINGLIGPDVAGGSIGISIRK